MWVALSMMLKIDKGKLERVTMSAKTLPKLALKLIEVLFTRGEIMHPMSMHGRCLPACNLAESRQWKVSS